MESELSPDKAKETPEVPIKTYQWEDLRRSREAGAYPWTHLLKPPLEGEITAQDIIRETTPRRSMSREFSRSRTRSPVGEDVQKILILDSSPGSSRKHGEEGEDEGVHIPNFSKEISLEEDDGIVNSSLNSSTAKRPESRSSGQLIAPVEIPTINVSPKGILKRRVPEQYIGVSETREKTKCCHPLVNKIKHLADKTLQKLDKGDSEKSPLSKRKKNNDGQEIRQLRNSPGAVRRQKFSAIKLGDSDEMSKTLSLETPPARKKKEHIYEDIEESKENAGKLLQFSPDVDIQNKTKVDSEGVCNKEIDSNAEKRSNTSQDPSLVADNISLKSGEHVMEKLHKNGKALKEVMLLDDEMDQDEPNVDEIFQNQLDETRNTNESPNITITEITDDDTEVNEKSNQPTAIPIETSPSPSPQCNIKDANIGFSDLRWSKPSSDHEYEIIEKPPPNIVYTSPSIEENPRIIKGDDDLSSTTSLERKCLQHTSDEDELHDEKETIHDNTNENILNAEALQKDIEDRFFVNTPSTVSRTECEVSTSQVDSSALEQLPLKRGSRTKANNDGGDNKLQQRIKESTGKLRSQAGKLKTRLQNMKTNKTSTSERPKFSLLEKSRFKTSEKTKTPAPDRPKFNLADKINFKLPDRPKFKSLNLSNRISLPDRPKFTVPDLPKFKIPDRSKINFPSLGRKKEHKTGTSTSNSTTDVSNVATVDFEAKTFPRLFSRKKKSKIQKTSSSPTLNREDTPPPTFTFVSTKKSKEESGKYIPDSPEEPREYGGENESNNFERAIGRKFETTYDFDKVDIEYMNEESIVHHDEDQNDLSTPADISPTKQEYTHVITEINNDEFFVRPRGISREDIQMREYLSDETRQAFKNPKNVLALMGSSTEVNDDNLYINDDEQEPEFLNENELVRRYSSEDLNDKDDGYYTFPPVRPSRAKRKKKEQDEEPTPYIDESVNASMQFSEVDLVLRDEVEDNKVNGEAEHEFQTGNIDRFGLSLTNDLHAIHEYANDEVIQYPDTIPLESQTLPMPPKRKKKFGKKDITHSSLNDFNFMSSSNVREEDLQQQNDDIIVYRTEHEYTIPKGENIKTQQSPVPPRRNRSRSSRATSICDDDRTSHGAESLTLDTHCVPVASETDDDRILRHESPGYATVDKAPYTPSKGIRRSVSKTPPARRRKSNSSERKYYTVASSKAGPDRPPRKKSSTSLLTLNSYTKRSPSGDITQYVEIDEPFEIHNHLNSGDIINKMKDRPLPPPPRPPRGSRRKHKDKNEEKNDTASELENVNDKSSFYLTNATNNEDVMEIEVSTQTDPLPDDVDFELGMDDNLDVSMSSSLRDIIDEDSILSKSHTKIAESPRFSRPTSRSEKSLKFSDPKISELSKPHIGRTSPTVILVEKRVSSPTRINEREEMLTEASLTVQHIDIDETQIPDVPPLPRPKGITNTTQSKNNIPSSETQALERISDATKDVQLDNIITQRLQVRDLDVARLNVSEIQANKILVSDIEGMTLQVSELDSKSGHISVSGIEFSQSVIDEIVKKFAEISTAHPSPLNQHTAEPIPSREEETQTEGATETKIEPKSVGEEMLAAPIRPQRVGSSDDGLPPPQRPPPPDLTPLLYSYLQDITIPPTTFTPPRSVRERPFSEFHEPQHQTPPPPARRAKRKPPTHHTESSSDDGRLRPSPRRVPPPVKTQEPTIAEAGVQFLRVCQSSISRTIRNMFNLFMSYVSGTEDKKDVQMALVIFLVLVAGLIMFGLSDSRAIHHHHWEFFNPPDGNP